MRYLSLLALVLVIVSCSSKNTDWDSGANKQQADMVEENSELQNSVQNQAPPLKQ